MESNPDQDKSGNGNSSPSQGTGAAMSPDPNTGNPEKYTNEGASKENPPQFRTFRKPGSEWIMVLFTAVIAFWAGLQWYEMHGSGKQADKLITAATKLADAARDQAQAAKDTANATGKQVDAANRFASSAEGINQGVAGAVIQLQAAAKNAKDSIEATQKAMRLDQRAWVGPVAVSQFELKAGEIIPTIVVTVRNSGKTPALAMTSITTMQFVNPGQSFHPTLGKTATPQAIDVIQPNGELQLPSSLGMTKLNDAAIDRLRAGASILYVYGEVKYRDVFDAEHVSRFCMFVSRDLKTLSSCDEYNEAN